MGDPSMVSIVLAVLPSPRTKIFQRLRVRIARTTTVLLPEGATQEPLVEHRWWPGNDRGNTRLNCHPCALEPPHAFAHNWHDADRIRSGFDAGGSAAYYRGRRCERT